MSVATQAIQSLIDSHRPRLRNDRDGLDRAAIIGMEAALDVAAKAEAEYAAFITKSMRVQDEGPETRRLLHLHYDAQGPLRTPIIDDGWPS